jgi:hypothetical protein
MLIFLITAVIKNDLARYAAVAAATIWQVSSRVQGDTARLKSFELYIYAELCML